ncbi:MAG: metallophosphoesterase [Gammaproteobacteria bacterium]|nr:metallophosphoesterase [Gammaproteobacteria bacterium]MCP5137834.1 metallophosphoesterase [Gammaproteobacteria bacterium]
MRQRIGVETEHEADRFGQGRNFLHIENWHLFHSLIRMTLRLTGMAERGRRNVLDIQVRHNDVRLPTLPPSFDGFTLLHLSDLHLDSLPEFPGRVAEVVSDLDYDVCVMTGDYRFHTHGPWQAAMAGLSVVREALGEDIYAVLGNHDSIFMVEPIERMGIRLLLNESVTLERGDARIYIAGIDDPHYFESDNLDAASQGLADESIAVLLSHSPEIYTRAAYTGFDLMLSGHTHAGQMCLPGGKALMYNSAAPNEFNAGPWSFNALQGYTSAGTGSSVVPARFNCPPEVTLHHLRRV